MDHYCEKPEIVATAHGIPVDANMMKLIQGYMLALIAGNESMISYFENRIDKVEINHYVTARPNMFDA